MSWWKFPSYPVPFISFPHSFHFSFISLLRHFLFFLFPLLFIFFHSFLFTVFLFPFFPLHILSLLHLSPSFFPLSIHLPFISSQLSSFPVQELMSISIIISFPHYFLSYHLPFSLMQDLIRIHRFVPAHSPFKSGTSGITYPLRSESTLWAIDLETEMRRSTELPVLLRPGSSSYSNAQGSFNGMSVGEGGGEGVCVGVEGKGWCVSACWSVGGCGQR